jgi:hypothetical protein
MPATLLSTSSLRPALAVLAALWLLAASPQMHAAQDPGDERTAAVKEATEAAVAEPASPQDDTRAQTKADTDTKSQTSPEPPVLSDTGETDPEVVHESADVLPDVDITLEGQETEQLTLPEQIDLFEQKLLLFEESREAADEMYIELRDQLRVRLWQFDMALDRSFFPLAPADIDPVRLARHHPGFAVEKYELAPGVVTMRDLHQNMLEVYQARLRLLDLVSAELYGEVVGTELRGIQELGSELDLIVLEVRYQALRLPEAVRQIRRMLTRAPVPLIWFVVQLWLAIVIFRWWRRWLPGTMQRMRGSLLSIRPRTNEILTQLRALWYIDQIRAPVEWLLLIMFLFGLFHFDGLEFVRDIGSIIVRWILLSWFAVTMLNAIAARGAGGLAGESAQLRLKSLRLIAAWLVLLGLGQELSIQLTGAAVLNSWVWRVFQLLAFPLALRLLSIWHRELYRRLEREGEPDIPVEEYAAQTGLRKCLGAAKVAGLVLASWLQRTMLRRIDRFDPGRATARGNARSGQSASAAVTMPLPDEMRNSMLEGQADFTKYVAAERRALVDRINRGEGGIVGIVGERGIGKAGFLRQVVDGHEHGSVVVSCRAGHFNAVVADFQQQLGLGDGEVSSEDVSAAILQQDIRLIVVDDLHLLVRPVMGGFEELKQFVALVAKVNADVIWAFSIDGYANQFISRARADYALPGTWINLRAWSEEQIGDFIEKRCKTAGLQPDFGNIRVPRQYMDTAQSAIEERNRAGIYAMITALSRGNPSIAMRLFVNCLNRREDGTIEVTLPANPDTYLIENAHPNMLLVLRVIVRSELVRFDDIVANLRLDPALVKAVIHMSLLRGWVELEGDRYRIAWPWFRSVTRILERQNLLAGMQTEVMS